MTHYEVDYSELSGEAKDAKALQDIKDFIGEDKFNKITEENRNETYTFRQFEIGVSFGGISGYPVKAWFKHIWPNGIIPSADQE